MRCILPPWEPQEISNSVLSVNNVKLSLEMVWNRVIIVNRDPAYFYLYIDSPNHPPPQK